MEKMHDLRYDGWDEVTKVEIRVTGVYKPFNTAGWWVDYQTRHPQMNTMGRNHCQCCQVRWVDSEPDTMTYFVMTTKGNKVLCHNCFEGVAPGILLKTSTCNTA